MDNIVSLNEDTVFKTLQICKIKKGSGKNLKVGIICLGVFNMTSYLQLKPFCGNVHLMIQMAFQHRIKLISYDYYGNYPVESYCINEWLTDDDIAYKYIESKRNLRSVEKLKPILNFLDSSKNLDSVKLPEWFTYTEPYIKKNDKIICMWHPLHKNDVKPQDFSIQGDYLVYYYYETPVYMLLKDAKRHIAKYFKEKLCINLKTGRITRDCNYIATNSILTEAKYILDTNNIWKLEKCKERVVVLGSKTQLNGKSLTSQYQEDFLNDKNLCCM